MGLCTYVKTCACECVYDALMHLRVNSSLSVIYLLWQASVSASLADLEPKQASPQGANASTSGRVSDTFDMSCMRPIA